MVVPIEIQEHIMLYTSFEECIKNGYHKVAKKLYNPKKHSWNYIVMNGNLDIVKWLHVYIVHFTASKIKWSGIGEFYRVVDVVAIVLNKFFKGKPAPEPMVQAKGMD